MLTRVFNRKVIPTAVLALLLCTPIANAQGTSFTYQGKLSNAGNPATGSFDMQFKVFDALTGGTQQGDSVTNPAVQATAGIFTVELDFGAQVFDGTARYLEDNGIVDKDTIAEMTMVTAKVIANSRNRRPTTSAMNSSGMSTAIRDTVSEMMVKPISCDP